MRAHMISYNIMYYVYNIYIYIYDNNMYIYYYVYVVCALLDHHNQCRGYNIVICISQSPTGSIRRDCHPTTTATLYYYYYY